MTSALLARSVPPSVLRPVPSEVPDDELGPDELGARIVGLAGRLAAATCRWLLLVARFDAVDGASRAGLPSTARWLAHTCGLAHRTAVEHVRVARALAEFGALAREMGEGRLSYSQVRAISRVPQPGEDQVVDDLIEIARHGSAGQLETVVRGLRSVDDDAAALPEHYLRSSWTQDSQWRCSARLAAEDGAVVAAAVEAVARAGDLTLPQALVRMAEIALAAVNDNDRQPRPLRGDERAAVIVHLDASAVEPPPAGNDSAAAAPDANAAPGAADQTVPRPALPPGSRPRSAERGVVDGHAACAAVVDGTEPLRRDRWPFARIADGPGLPRPVVERLLCAGRVRTVVHDGRGSVLDLGRSHRLVSEKLYRALLLRDKGCCGFPGCTSRNGLEAHHVRHWLYGGRTDLANLVLLCKAHHLGHHHAEFSIGVTPAGGFTFRRADGRLLDARVDPEPLARPLRGVDAEHGDVDDDAAMSRWDGQRLDRHYAVAVLAQRRAG